MNKVLYKRSGFLLLLINCFTVLMVTAQDKFPVPAGNPNQLFYLQRTANTNTIICELNYKRNILDPEEPVHVYWIRYDDKGQKEELNYIQKSLPTE